MGSGKRGSMAGVDAGTSETASKIAHAMKRHKKAGLSPCQKLLLLVGGMIVLCVALYALSVLRPVRRNPHAAAVRQILQPLFGRNSDLEKHLSATIDQIRSEEEAKAFLEKAVAMEEAARAEAEAADEKRHVALDQLLEIVTQSQQEAAANPEGLSSQLDLSAEDLATLQEYMAERKQKKQAAGEL